MGFDEARTAQQVARNQEELLKQADQLRETLEALEDAARRGEEPDTPLARRLSEIGDQLNQALTPELIAARARYLLEAPDTVTLAARDGALVATGSAPNRWIAEARARSRMIVGISRYDDSGLTDADSTGLDDLRRRIEGRVLLFALGSAELTPEREGLIRETAVDLKELSRLATRLDRTARVEVIGRGDSVGTEDVNLGISRRRADGVVAALRPEEIGGLTLAVTGVGSTQPLRPEVTERDRELNRSVSFRVILADNREKESQRR